MKKSLALALALVVVLSLSVSAFAGSPVASAHNTGATSGVPSAKTVATLTELGKADTLDADAKAAFEAAYADLANVTPDGYAAQYFCYVSAEKYPAEVSVEITNAADVAAKLYANGAWQDLTCTANGSKVSIAVPGEGVLAIFTK